MKMKLTAGVAVLSVLAGCAASPRTQQAQPVPTILPDVPHEHVAPFPPPPKHFTPMERAYKRKEFDDALNKAVKGLKKYHSPQGATYP